MFDFLFQNKKGELTSLLDIIAANTAKISFAALAREKAVNMIAKAIAKSEIVVSDGSTRVIDDNYISLNVRPNPNQSGTEFWFTVVKTLLLRGEALVVPVSGKLYLAQSWTTDNYVLAEKYYSNITITDGTDTLLLHARYPAGEVLHFRLKNTKLRLLEDSVLSAYGEVMSAMTEFNRIAATPRFKFSVDANASFRKKDANGNEIKITLDDVIENLREQLGKSGIQVIRETKGTELKYMDIDSKVSAEDFNAMADRMNETCAMVYDIPLSVFTGELMDSEDENATNAFVTFALEPIVEMMNDVLASRFVGTKEYIRGERAFIWLARFKHTDVIDTADNLDKLRGIGFSFDEIRGMVGYEPLGTEWSQARALTKNYAVEGEEGDAAAVADDPDEPSDDSSHKQSKHRERRKKRYGR
jgi:HK97 family phage portal protein